MQPNSKLELRHQKIRETFKNNLKKRKIFQKKIKKKVKKNEHTI